MERSSDRVCEVLQLRKKLATDFAGTSKPSYVLETAQQL